MDSLLFSFLADDLHADVIENLDVDHIISIVHDPSMDFPGSLCLVPAGGHGAL